MCMENQHELDIDMMRFINQFTISLLEQLTRPTPIKY